MVISILLRSENSNPIHGDFMISLVMYLNFAPESSKEMATALLHMPVEGPGGVVKIAVPLLIPYI